MPLSAAEKMKRRREKLKIEGKYDEYKRKHQEACQKSRAKKKREIDSLPESKKKIIIRNQRKKTKERVARFRKKKQELEVTEDPNLSSSFSTPQALGKATARARRVLPKCLQKKKQVLSKLLKDCGVEPPNLTSQQTKHASALSDEVIIKIKDFYQRDDISRQAPGLKDFVSVRNEDGIKEKVQIRHLYASLSETHALFIKEHGEIVKKSKFAELRPKHVYLSNKLPHNVCLCKYHENYALALNSLHSICESPKYYHDFIRSVICENPSKRCWLNTCDICKQALNDKLQEWACDKLYLEVSWYVWKEFDGKIHKLQETDTVNKLIEHILDMTPTFFEHSNIKRYQADCYRKDRNAISSPTCDPAIALMQVDFSENFTCVAQDEIQSFHWVQPQVTLFTVSLWYLGKQHPIVIVSDDRHHDKKTSLIYIERILKELPESIKEVHIWSDGPSSQFKNKFIANSLKILEERNHVRLIWNYFATSHGKGPVDGIGGALKRLVRNKVMKREVVVFNAEQFVNAAKDSTIKVLNVSPNEIDKTAKEMNLDSVFSEAPAVVGISKSHLIYWENNMLQMTQTSNDVNMGIKEMRSYYEQVYGSDSDSFSSEDNIPLSVLKLKSIAS